MQSLITVKWIQVTLFCLGIFIILFSVFLGGVTIGERKARHFDNWSRNYPSMFPRMYDPLESPNRLMPGMGLSPRRAPMPFPHGIFGTVISTSTGSLVVQGKDHIEQTILVTDKTIIRAGRDTASFSLIKQNAEVGVFGEPNAQGQIEAKLIRLFSQP